ncbi:MAG TPA: hypothetical protein VF774_14830 [Pseudoduganella sp.]|jgi:hypothetical protein
MVSGISSEKATIHYNTLFLFDKSKKRKRLRMACRPDGSKARRNWRSAGKYPPACHGTRNDSTEMRAAKAVQENRPGNNG